MHRQKRCLDTYTICWNHRVRSCNYPLWWLCRDQMDTRRCWFDLLRRLLVASQWKSNLSSFRHERMHWRDHWPSRLFYLLLLLQLETLFCIGTVHLEWTYHRNLATSLSRRLLSSLLWVHKHTYRSDTRNTTMQLNLLVRHSSRKLHVGNLLIEDHNKCHCHQGQLGRKRSLCRCRIAYIANSLMF